MHASCRPGGCQSPRSRGEIPLPRHRNGTRCAANYVFMTHAARMVLSASARAWVTGKDRRRGVLGGLAIPCQVTAELAVERLPIEPEDAGGPRPMSANRLH